MNERSGSMLRPGLADTMSERTTVRLRGDELELAADRWGSSGDPVILMHGGGQTRHAWDPTARALADRGLRAITYDARGHGNSGWSADAEEGYRLECLARDLIAVTSTLDAPPILVGASLGGYTAMYAVGKLGLVARALVLVDIAPQIEPAGVRRIFDFMTGHEDGFESLEAAADAVARYLPHRRRPPTLDGLRKNLRRRENGRYYWHWDPAFVAGMRRHRPSRALLEDEGIVRSIAVPTLLIRGGRSDLLSEEGVAHFLAMVPHARAVDVSDAAHMVAGDQNDRFSRAVLEFIEAL